MSSLTQTPDLSIIILTWNSEKHIRKCVEKTFLEASNARLSAECYIVDNGSSDSTLRIIKKLKEQWQQIDVISLGNNHGTTKSRNLALYKSRGKYICILDSDAYPLPGCILALVNKLVNNPNIGIAVPKIIYPDGRYQKSTDQLPTLGLKIKRILLLHHLESKEIAPRCEKIGYAISAFWMLKRDLLESVGYLDESIFYAPEDAEYCLRVWKSGKCVYYEPEAVAVHEAQEKSRSIFPNRLTVQHVKGLLYMFKKHKYLLRAPALKQ